MADMTPVHVPALHNTWVLLGQYSIHTDMSCGRPIEGFTAVSSGHVSYKHCIITRWEAPLGVYESTVKYT